MPLFCLLDSENYSKLLKHKHLKATLSLEFLNVIYCPTFWKIVFGGARIKHKRFSWLIPTPLNKVLLKLLSFPQWFLENGGVFKCTIWSQLVFLGNPGKGKSKENIGCFFSLQTFLDQTEWGYVLKCESTLTHILSSRPVQNEEYSIFFQVHCLDQV